MRILYVSPYPPTRDGIGNYTHLMASAVLADGHDVRVITPGAMLHCPPEVVGALSSLGTGPSSVHGEVLKWRPHVIHVQFAVAAFASRTVLLIRWLQQIRSQKLAPIVITMHEVTRDVALLRSVGRLIYRKLVSCSDYIIVHTQSGRQLLTEMLDASPSVLRIIPHPAARPSDEILSTTDLRARFGLEGKRILLSFGFIHVDKGLDDLVGALGCLKQSNPGLLADISLVVAGAIRPRHNIFRVFELRDWLYLRRVRRIIRQGGIRHHVIFAGYVPDGEVAAWFRSAAAVVLPYRRADQSGVAGLANAFDAVVLSSTVGGLGEQFGTSPYQFEPGDKIGLCRVLEDFISSRSAAVPNEPVVVPANGIAPVLDMTYAVYRSVTQICPEEVPRGSQA